MEEKEKNNQQFKEYLLEDLKRIDSHLTILENQISANNINSENINTIDRGQKIKTGSMIMKSNMLYAEFQYACNILEGGFQIDLEDILTKKQFERLTKINSDLSALPYIKNGTVEFNKDVMDLLDKINLPKN